MYKEGEAQAGRKQVEYWANQKAEARAKRKYRMAKEEEAARYMLAIVGSMRFIDAYELIHRLPPFPLDIEQRINALGWQPKLLAYNNRERVIEARGA